jgi:hypothetical protein
MSYSKRSLGERTIFIQIVIVLLRSPRNHLEDLKPLAQLVLEALKTIQPEGVIQIGL